MLYNYFTEKLLGLQGVLIENIEEIDDTIHIYCKLDLIGLTPLMIVAFHAL